MVISQVELSLDEVGQPGRVVVQRRDVIGNGGEGLSQAVGATARATDAQEWPDGIRVILPDQAGGEQQQSPSHPPDAPAKVVRLTGHMAGLVRAFSRAGLPGTAGLVLGRRR